MSHLHGQGIAAPPILLTIAGFDPSCGAGVGADLKTFAAHGCYGVAAITSLTVQNTQGVSDVHNAPSATLRALGRPKSASIAAGAASKSPRFLKTNARKFI